MSMYKLKISCFLLIGLYFAQNGQAQEVLTIEQVIGIALQQNHDIKVAQYDVAISENNVIPANAGLLPKLDASASTNRGRSDTELEFANPENPPIDVSGASSTTNDASLGLSYTIFDGLGNVYRFRQLKQFNAISELQARITIENTLIQAISSYLEVARQKENYNIAQQTVDISRERLERTQTRYDYGNALKIDVLTAEVDLNSDSVTLSQVQLALRNTKRDLNLLLGRDPGTMFDISEELALDEGKMLDELLSGAQTRNAQLLLAQNNLGNADLDVKIAKADIFPKLNLNGSYGYSKTENGASFIKSQSSLGLNGGVSLSFNIFDGKRKRTVIQNAKIGQESQTVLLDKTKMQVDRDVMNAYDIYQNSLFLLRAENKNLATAQLNFERTEEAYNLGQVTNTQLRDAQINLITAEVNINNLTNSAKLAEVELLRLAGELYRQE